MVVVSRALPWHAALNRPKNVSAQGMIKNTEEGVDVTMLRTVETAAISQTAASSVESHSRHHNQNRSQVFTMIVFQ